MSKIAPLFGGKSRPPVDETAGLGGAQMAPGPAGQSGFPGSTSTTRTLRGRNPRAAKVRSDTNYGFEQDLSSTPQVRQEARRSGDAQQPASPRDTATVATPQPLLTLIMQMTRATLLGGPMQKTGPGNRTAGGHPLSAAAAEGGHSERDTTTPWTQAEPEISGGVPGSQNVRNTVAQRYKAAPGQSHTYQSAARGDLPMVNPSGQASDGNVHPERAAQPVTVESRFVFGAGGVETWSILREMPYGGRGNGARGAALDGTRYYGTGQGDQFWNAGMGEYGVARKGGGKRPVSFTTPAPWSSNFYDTTEGEQAGSMDQAPDSVYVSPSAGRAGNGTGRAG